MRPHHETANGTQTYRWAAEILYKVHQHGTGAGDRHAMGAGDWHAMGAGDRHAMGAGDRHAMGAGDRHAIVALNKQLQLVDEQLTPGK